MAVLGIVAEYDPLHNGHLYHLSEAKSLVKPDLTYVVLSPCIKQRGDLPLLSPLDRARLALEAGADAVFALPVLWTVRDAEHYALGAVSLLASLGVTHLVCGMATVFSRASTCTYSGKSSSLMIPPSESTIACSMMFSSSRMLPG